MSEQNGHPTDSCEQAGRLNAYYDGEMPANERAEFERHLRECGRCRAERERFEAMSGALRSVDFPQMPPAALERLHEMIDNQPATLIRRMAGAMSAVAAAILVVCLIGVAKQARMDDAANGLPVWETEMVAQEPSSASPEDSVTAWITEDLSSEDEP